MKAVFLRTCTLLLTASLAACAGTGGGNAGGGTQVTANHLGQPIARARIAVEAFDPADANMLEFGAYSAAVARELTRLGWTVVNTAGQSEQVALIDVQQGSRASLSGHLGGTAAAGASAGAATLLEVRIRRRSDGTVMWEGGAIADAPAATTPAARTAAVDRLAAALFRDFPGISGRTIRAR